MTDDPLLLSLVAVSAVSSLAFAWATLLSWQSYHHALSRALEERTGTRSKNNAEHGLVVSTTLLLVSLGTVITGLFAPGVTAISSYGSVLIRGALLAAAIYLVIRHPRPPKAEQ